MGFAKYFYGRNVWLEFFLIVNNWQAKFCRYWEDKRYIKHVASDQGSIRFRDDDIVIRQQFILRVIILNMRKIYALYIPFPVPVGRDGGDVEERSNLRYIAQAIELLLSGFEILIESVGANFGSHVLSLITRWYRGGGGGGRMS